MDINEYIKKLDKFTTGAGFYQNFDKFFNMAAMDMKAAIEKRVVNTGVNADGQKFKGYSTKTTLVGQSSFTKKAAWNTLFNAEKKKGKANQESGWRTVKTKSGKTVHLILLAGGYAAIRRFEGRQTGHKSFERTGEMWKGFGLTMTKDTPTQKEATLLGKTAASQDKLQWNSEREGISIIDPTQAEIDALNKRFQKWIIDEIRKGL